MLTARADDIKSNVTHNQHIFDWFFTERTESFVKHWLYNTLGAKWHWFRYEFAVQRGSIHCHGLAKLSSDPGLCELTKIALDGFIAKEKLKSNVSFSEHEVSEFNTVIHRGSLAEKQICNYNDLLLSTCNPVNESEWVRPLSHPCKKRSVRFQWKNLIRIIQTY